MNKKIFQIIFLIFLLFSISCDMKKQSVGRFDVIYVFADSIMYNEIAPVLEQTFDRYIYTPGAEKSFYLQWEPLENLNVFQMHKNLIFVGLFNQNDAASLYIMKMLSSDVQQAILDGKIFHIFQEDLFSKNQMITILFAPNITQLIENINKYSEDIYRHIEKYHFNRLEEIMFSIDEQIDLENYLAENLGWKIRVPFEYKLVKQSDNSDFAWFRKIRPDRNIFIYKFKTSRFIKSENWLYNLRDSLTTLYFEGDSIVREDVYSIKTEFYDRTALKLIGVWKNNKYYIGGPFRTYTFFNKQTNLQYLIDISVFAPKQRKKPYLDELEIIANSYQLIPAKIE